MDVAVLAGDHLGQLAAVVGHAQALRHLPRQGDAAGLVGEVARPLRARRRALAQVVHQAGPAHRQRSLQPRRLLQHQHLVYPGVDLGVVGLGLRHAPQTVHLGQQAPQRAAVAQDLDHALRLGLHQAARQLLPHALGHQGVDLAVVHQVPKQRHRLRRDDETFEACGEARRAQQAHRVLGEGLADVAQHAVAQVARAAEGVDQRAVGAQRHGVDGQVAPGQILLQRHVGGGMEAEAVIPRAGLALGAGQRIFLVRGGM